MRRYVLQGPSGAGNLFGHYKPDFLPADRWAVVECGEYANGGYGPCTIDGRMYASREAAEAALAAAGGEMED